MEPTVSPELRQLLDNNALFTDQKDLPTLSYEEGKALLSGGPIGQQRTPFGQVAWGAVGAGAGELVLDIGTLLMMTGQALTPEGSAPNLTPTTNKVLKWTGDVLQMLGREGEMLGDATKEYWTKHLDPALEGPATASYDYWVYQFVKMGVPFLATMGAAKVGISGAKLLSGLSRVNKGARVLQAAKLGAAGATRGIETAAGMVSAGVVGGGLAGANTYRRALAMGKSATEAREDALAMMFFAGALNTFSAGQLFKPGGAGFLKGMLRRTEAGMIEGITEALEEPTEAYILGQDVYSTIEQMATVAPVAFLYGFLFSGSLALDKAADFTQAKLDLYKQMEKNMTDSQKFQLKILQNAYLNGDWATINIITERLDASIETTTKHRQFLASEAAKLTKAIAWEGASKLDAMMDSYKEAKAEQGKRFEQIKSLSPDVATLKLSEAPFSDEMLSEVVANTDEGFLEETTDAAIIEASAGNMLVQAQKRVQGMRGTPTEKFEQILKEAVVDKLATGNVIRAIQNKNTILDVVEEYGAEAFIEEELRPKLESALEMFGIDPKATVQDIERAQLEAAESVPVEEAEPAAETSVSSMPEEDLNALMDTIEEIQNKEQGLAEIEELRSLVARSKVKRPSTAEEKVHVESIRQAHKGYLARHQNDPASPEAVAAKALYRRRVGSLPKSIDELIRTKSIAAVQDAMTDKMQSKRNREQMYDDIITAKATGKLKDIKADRTLIARVQRKPKDWEALRRTVDEALAAAERVSTPEQSILANKSTNDVTKAQRELASYYVDEYGMLYEDAVEAIKELDRDALGQELVEFRNANGGVRIEEDFYEDVNPDTVAASEDVPDGAVIEEYTTDEIEEVLDGEIIEEEVADDHETTLQAAVAEIKDMVEDEDISDKGDIAVGRILDLSMYTINKMGVRDFDQFAEAMDEHFGGNGTTEDWLSDMDALTGGAIDAEGIGSMSGLYTKASSFMNENGSLDLSVLFADIDLKHALGRLKRDFSRLEIIGRNTLARGFNTYSKWYREMRSKLGQMWNVFKDKVKDIWKRITLPLQNERGSLDLSIFKNTFNTLKEVIEVHKRIRKGQTPEAMGRVNQFMHHAKGYIKAGSRDNAAWIREIINMYGEENAPYLRPAWAAAVREINAEKIEARRAARAEARTDVYAVKIIAQDKNGNIVSVPVDRVSELDRQELFDTVLDADFLLNKLGEALTNPEYVFESMDHRNGSGVWRKLFDMYGRAERLRKQDLDIIFREIDAAFKGVDTKKLGVYSILKDQQGEEGVDGWVETDMETLLRADGFGDMINEVRNWDMHSAQYAVELNAYKTMQKHFAKTLKSLNEVRQRVGKEPIRERFNYFTFVRVDEGLKAEGKTFLDANGLDITTMLKTVLEGGHVMTKAEEAKFEFTKRNPNAIKPIELDALKVFATYMGAAKTYEHFTPMAMTARSLIGKWKFKRADGHLATFQLNRSAPKFSEYVDRWVNYILGAKDKREFGTSNWNKFDNFVNGLAQNVATFTLGASLRSIAIQPMANLFTSVYIGPNWVGKGIKSILSGEAKWILHDQNEYHRQRDRLYAEARAEGAITSEQAARIEHEALTRAHRSDHLLTRTPDVLLENVQKLAAGGEYEKARAAITQTSFLGLQWMDKVTAEMGWVGAYKKLTAQGLDEKAAAKGADRIIRKTHAAAGRGYRAPIQRTAIGKALTMFQTFAIGEFNFVIHEVFKKNGLTNPDGTIIKGMDTLQKERARRIMTLFIMSALINSLYEDLLGLSSPLPSPMRNYFARLENDEGRVTAMMRALGTEFLGQIPVIGGGVQYGSSIGGPLGDIYQDFNSIMSGKRPADSWKLLMKLGGVSAGGQIYKSVRNYQEGEDWFDIITGSYQPSRFLWAEYINRML